MENLWNHMESVCGARLSRHFGIVPAEGAEQPRPGRTEFALRWRPDQMRLGTRELSDATRSETEAPGDVLARLIAKAEQFEADEQPAATRAVLESRIVGLALAGDGSVSEAPAPERLERLPVPAPEPVFAEQLAILYRRAAAGLEIGWAIERVVAELYELPLERLVDVQAGIRAGG